MDSLTALYQQFDPLQPLPASDNTLYIDWQHELMPYDDVKLRLVNAVARSGGAPVARLLTGHRGTGKTTEIYRVQQMLMEGKKSHKVFVSFLEREEWLDLNDVSPQDLVLQMVRQLVNDLKKAGYGFGYEQIYGLLPGNWRNPAERCRVQGPQDRGRPHRVGHSHQANSRRTCRPAQVTRRSAAPYL